MSDRTDAPSVEMLDEARRAVEAVLLVATDPTPVQLLAQLVELPADAVQAMCVDLAEEYERDRRGFQLVQVAGGWRYQTHPDTHAYVERFALEGIPNRLSTAALETLAIVAYKQPLSRQQIGAIRGVNVDGVLRTLVQRGYVEERGKDDGPGQATLFGTTPFFLEQVGLMSLDELPPLGDFVPSARVLEALEHTLKVEGVEPARSDLNGVEGRANGAATNGSSEHPVGAAGNGAARNGSADNGSGHGTLDADAVHDRSPVDDEEIATERTVDDEEIAAERTVEEPVRPLAIGAAGADDAVRFPVAIGGDGRGAGSSTPEPSFPEAPTTEPPTTQPPTTEPPTRGPDPADRTALESPAPPVDRQPNPDVDRLAGAEPAGDEEPSPARVHDRHLDLRGPRSSLVAPDDRTAPGPPVEVTGTGSARWPGEPDSGGPDPGGPDSGGA